MLQLPAGFDSIVTLLRTRLCGSVCRAQWCITFDPIDGRGLVNATAVQVLSPTALHVKAPLEPGVGYNMVVEGCAHVKDKLNQPLMAVCVCVCACCVVRFLRLRCRCTTLHE